MSVEGRRAITSWMMLFSSLPKEHPDHEAQQLTKTMVLAAAMGGAFMGGVVGLIVGLML